MKVHSWRFSLLCLVQAKISFEHAYAVTAWDLSLLHDIQADCMECLSYDNKDLR